MYSWRKIVLDVLNGIDKDTDKTVREAIVQCRNEPPTERSGSLREAIMDLQEAATPLLFSDMDKTEQAEWIKNTVKYGVKLSLKLKALPSSQDAPVEDSPMKVQNMYATALDSAYEFTDALIESGFDSEGTPRIPKVFPYHDKFFGKISLADWQMMNKVNRSDIEKWLKRMEASLEKVQEYENAEAERRKEYDTPCKKVFERLVFNMKKSRGTGNEQNTKREIEIHQNVEEWISGVDVIPNEMIRDFQFIKKCAKEYPDYFSPSVTVIWRGITIEGSKKALEFLPVAELLKSRNRLQIGKGTYIGAPTVYKATKPIQSWAAEPRIAANEFGTGDSHFPTLKNKEVQDWIKAFNAGTMSKQDIAEEFRGIHETIMTDSKLGIVYSMKTDEDCIFSEWFANQLGRDILMGAHETEVTRVTTKGKTTPAMVYVQEIFVEAVRAYNQAVDTVSAALGSKMPKSIKKIGL